MRALGGNASWSSLLFGSLQQTLYPCSPIGDETNGESYGYGLYLVERRCESRGFAFQFSKDVHQAVGQLGFKSR